MGSFNDDDEQSSGDDEDNNEGSADGSGGNIERFLGNTGLVVLM